jgi:hypothetical protein
MSGSYRDIKVWQKAIEFVVDVIRVLGLFHATKIMV